MLAATDMCLKGPELKTVWGLGGMPWVGPEAGVSPKPGLLPQPNWVADFCFNVVLILALFHRQDLRPLYAGRCQYYSKSTTPPEVRAAVALLSPCRGGFVLQVEKPPARRPLPSSELCGAAGRLGIPFSMFGAVLAEK